MKAFILREVRTVVPPTVFFIVTFNILAFTVALIARGDSGLAPTYAAATIAALICGKAVLIADKLPFFNRYPDKPLIWNAAWKAGLYVLVAMIFRFLERTVSAVISQYGFAAGVHEEIVAFSWPRFWAVQIWLLLLFLGYSAFRELAGELGPGRVQAMFFGAASRGAARP
jgi:hypothetical protein